MEIVLLQFGLMGLNLYSAKTQKENGRNPAFSYFALKLPRGGFQIF